MLRKLSIWSCFKIRTQDKIRTYGEVINYLKLWNSLNIWENPKESKSIPEEQKSRFEIREFLLPIGAESFVFQFAIQKCKD
jgi:hypothetical protein